jgi:hypothetical protein
MGVQQSPGPDPRDERQHQDQQDGRASARDVPEHQQLADSRAGAHLSSPGSERPVKTMYTQSANFFLVIHALLILWQAWDSFLSHILDFEGESPIPSIPVLARAWSADSASASSRGPSVGASKTRASKRKAKVAAASPPSKARKAGAGKPRVSKSISPHQERLQHRLPQTVLEVDLPCAGRPGNTLTCINSICIVLTLQFVQSTTGHRA